ncbi:MAG: TROVE domain-containing protein [Planctomycetes bacterium]|nr:TROVE domain-containing protein [Planctomycetota bacterium]MBI3845599.1 TROVE domain-containing protein [Planctomycetota bacterium]
MANKTLFETLRGKRVPKTNARNQEGAPAYAYEGKQLLTQLASTGCLNQTFYAGAEEQLEAVLAVCDEVEPEFIAKTALYCRRRGNMKDMPALLCAVLSVRSPRHLAAIFDRVIDNGRMLRTFVQIVRSGAVGRKSLGSLPKRLVLRWLESRDDEAVFRASVGQSPSLGDVVKMVHPKPVTASRRALYGWLIGREHDVEALPEIVRQFEAFKSGATREVPDVPFEMITPLELGAAGWTAIARRASWQATRMNLNTFQRHGVFADRTVVDLVAARLRDPEAIAKARVFPFQLLVAFREALAEIPASITEALQDAMEMAMGNVPVIEGRVFVCPDVSSSMKSPVTGVRRGASSAVKCVDVAALFAAAILRKNPAAEVIPFNDVVRPVRLNPRDSVMTNANVMASLCSGGTACSAPLALLNQRRAKGDVVIFVSDNQSWVDASGNRGTALLQEWTAFRVRNPRARLVCIDLQPYGTTQAAERDDVLNVGGFSDAVFEVVGEFAARGPDPSHWVDLIEASEL